MIEEKVRYEARLEIKAAYDPLELMPSDLERVEDDLRDTLEQLKNYSAKKAQDEVHREFRFDLCPACQKVILSAPLGGLPPVAP